MQPERETQMRTMPTLSDEEIGKISGNAPVSLKEAAARWHQLLGLPGVPTFGYVARQRIEIKEVSLEPSVDDPQKITTKMVTELDVAQDMCDHYGLMSQGCMTSLLDEGSAIALLLMKILEGGDDRIGVSQTLNIFFYQPVPAVGSRLRIVSRSLAISTENGTGSCICEIWDVARHKLVVSGTQIQMTPSRY